MSRISPASPSRRSLLPLPAILVALAFAAPARAQSFTITNYPSSGFPNGVAVADFDQDGRCDAATAHQNGTGPGSVNLFLGDGTGAFALPLVYATGFGCAGIACGDLNGDSWIDVATAETVNASSPTGRISVLRNDGAGGFLPFTSFVVGAGSRSVTLADLDLDGQLDAVTANSSTLANSVSFLRGNGLGGFAAAVDSFAGLKPWSIAAGDLNGDGKPDLAVANNEGGALSLLLNTGLGALAPPATYPTGPGPRGITLGHFDGDATLDVATANGSGNSVTVRLGIGGGFLAPAIDYPVGTNPSSITNGDLDANGTADLLVTDQTGAMGNLASVLLGDGSGAFAPANHFGVGNFPSSARITDFDSDGYSDAFVANYGGSGVTVLKNALVEPAGTFLYGPGTPGAWGTLGLDTNAIPQIGDAGFALVATNAPRHALGLLLLGNAFDVAGSDSLGVGLLLHVDVLASTELLGLDAPSDAAGGVFVPAPIPNDPALAGLAYAAQFVFVEAAGFASSPSPFHLVGSRGLVVQL